MSALLTRPDYQHHIAVNPMNPAEPGAGAASTTTCEACGHDVPAGAFCGYCGADLITGRGDRRGWLRTREYVAAPDEHLLRLSVASTLFPHLPARSRTPFRVGLVLLVVILAVLSLLGWQAPLIATCVLGLPLLFALYARESDIGSFDDLPSHWLALTVGVGIALGVGWGLIAGSIVTDAFDVGLSTGMTIDHILLEGVTIPTAGALLMLVPAVLVRVLASRAAESLDGFMVGSLGAVAFTAAATAARLAPQLADGPMIDTWPLSAVISEAGIRGLAMPAIAAAAGGLVGVALWFTKPGARRAGSLRPTALAAAVLAMVVLYAGLGCVEVLPLVDDLQLALHLLAAAVMLLVLRFGVQAAVLHESHPDAKAAEPLLCSHCNHVVPEMFFCPSCGVTARASSRSSRADRRLDAESTEPALPRPGYAVPVGSYDAVPLRHTKIRLVLLTMGIVLGITGALAFVVSDQISPGPGERYACPPECGRPPLGTPVSVNPRFTSRGGEFSVSYPGPGTAYRADMDPNGVVMEYISGDKGTLELFGQPAMSRSSRQIVEQLMKRTYPDARVEYEIPNAAVGYEPGYGVVADVYPQDPDARYSRVRVVVLVAIKHDYALIASAVGPFRRFTREISGLPSGANLELALDMGKYVNSFMWRGDPPR